VSGEVELTRSKRAQAEEGRWGRASSTLLNERVDRLVTWTVEKSGVQGVSALFDGSSRSGGRREGRKEEGKVDESRARS